MLFIAVKLQYHMLYIHKSKNLLEKNKRIGLYKKKSDKNKGIGLTMPITITSEINPILHCVFE